MKRLVKISIFIFSFFVFWLVAKVEIKADTFEWWNYNYTHMNDFIDNIGKISKEEIVVAVIDSGFDANHSWFEGRFVGGATCDYSSCIDGGYHIESTDVLNYTYDSHGTHVAGIIAKGTTKNVKILPIMVLPETIPQIPLLKVGPQLNLKVVIDYIIQKKNEGLNIKAINFSLGLYNKKNVVDEIYIENYVKTPIKKAYDAGILFVAGAGNDFGDANYALSGYAPETILVGAYNILGQQSYYSNTGERIDFMAPGTDIVSAALGTKYGVISYPGTSMAAPHITAKIALMYSMCPNCSMETIKQTMVDASVEMGINANCLPYVNAIDPPEGVETPTNNGTWYEYGSSCGHGWIDMNKAYDILKEITFRDIKVISRGKGTVTLGNNFNFANDALLFEPDTYATLYSKFLRPDKRNTYAPIGGDMAFSLHYSRAKKLKWIKIKIGKKVKKKITGKELEEIISKRYYVLENITEDITIEFKFKIF